MCWTGNVQHCSAAPFKKCCFLCELLVKLASIKLSQPGASLQPTSETWLDKMSNRLGTKEKFQPSVSLLLKVVCGKIEHFDGEQVTPNNHTAVVVFAVYAVCCV